MLGILIILGLSVLAIACAINVVTGLVGIGLAPSFPGYHELFMAKNYLADAILWALAGAVSLGAMLMVRDRARPRGEAGEPRSDPVRPEVAVCLVARDEERAIAKVVREFRERPEVRTVIVVDNNSTDATAVIAAREGAVVVHESKQGYGHACIRALREGLAAGLPVVVLCEADGTYSAADLPKLLLYLQHADLVVGSRTTPGLTHPSSQLDAYYSWLNQLGAKLLQLRYVCWQHLRYLGCARLTDLGCTYRAIRREGLERIVQHLSVGGDAFSPHMLAIAMRQGLTVVEVPVTFWPRIGVSKGAGGSLIRSVGAGIRMLREIMVPTAPRPEREGGLS